MNISQIASNGVNTNATPKVERVSSSTERTTTHEGGDQVQVSGEALRLEMERQTRMSLLSSMAVDSTFDVESGGIDLTTPLMITAQDLETEQGQRVQELFAEYGVDLSDAVGDDFSPEATAQRIVDFTTGLLDVWQRQNPDRDFSDMLDSFESTIRGAVDRGYGEAREILDGLEVADETIELGEKTMELVHLKLDDFFERARNGDLGASGAETQAVSVEVSGDSTYSATGQPANSDYGDSGNRTTA